MMEIRGKINSAICYASVIEDEAALQIRRMCDYSFSVGSKIRLEKYADLENYYQENVFMKSFCVLPHRAVDSVPEQERINYPQLPAIA